MTDYPRPATEPGDTRCPWHDTLVEGLGRSGRNGRLGNLEKKVKRLEEIQLRLMLLTCAGAFAGGGAAAGLIKLFSQ